MADNVKTPIFRASFPNLFRPTRPKNAPDTQDPKYSLTMLFAKDADLTELKKAAHNVLVEQFGADQTKWPKKLTSPFRDQGDMDYEGYEEGAIFIRATSKQKPGVVDSKVQPIIDEADVYPGCYMRATVRPFYYDTNGNKGVSFGLQNVQKVKDGEPLGGRTRAEDDFEAVASEDTGGGEKTATGIFG